MVSSFRDEKNIVAMIEAIAKLLKVLNSETEPGQISLAACLSMIAGLTPFYSLHILERLRKLKIVKILKASKFYEIYESATAWGGNP